MAAVKSVRFSLVVCILELQDVENRGNKTVWGLQGLNRAACEAFFTVTVRCPDESIDCLWCTKVSLTFWISRLNSPQSSRFPPSDFWHCQTWDKETRKTLEWWYIPNIVTDRWQTNLFETTISHGHQLKGHILYLFFFFFHDTATLWVYFVFPKIKIKIHPQCSRLHCGRMFHFLLCY